MAVDPHARLRRYLLDGEHVVVAVRRHWVQILEPSASAAAGLALTLWVEATVRPGALVLARLAWWAWFFLVARLVWHVVRWRLDWFVATDKRLVLTQGVLNRKVAMMPLAKVTDMSFHQSVPGRLLGYGRFVMESAGQEQSLREVDWVPFASHVYRVICAEIFGVDDHARVRPSPGDWDDPPPEPVTAGPDPGPVHSPVPGSETTYPGYRRPDGRDPDRGADTGPIVYRPFD